jgi:hypothetical protein
MIAAETVASKIAAETVASMIAAETVASMIAAETVASDRRRAPAPARPVTVAPIVSADSSGSSSTTLTGSPAR